MAGRSTKVDGVVFLEREGGRAVRGVRVVPTDVSLRLLVDGYHLASMVCLDGELETLALGWLFTEGFIGSAREVRTLVFHEDLYTLEIELDHPIDRERVEATRSLTSGCGRGVTYVDPALDGLFRPVGRTARLEERELWELAAGFGKMSPLHRDVGGVHSAYFRGRQGEILTEDVGRHNCVDRIAGTLLRRQETAGGAAGGRPGEGGLLMGTGRIATEIVTKCVRLGIEIVLSLSAPTASAVQLARDYGLTLIGYARGGKAVVYTGAERVAAAEV